MIALQSAFPLYLFTFFVTTYALEETVFVACDQSIDIMMQIDYSYLAIRFIVWNPYSCS